MSDEYPVSMLMSTLDLVVVTPQQSLREAWSAMVEASVQHVPVVEEDVLVGLISSWDLARLAMEQGTDALDDIAVAKVMERALVRIDPKTPVREAARLLAEGSFHSLPVSDTEGNLVGIVTSSDLIRYFALEE